MYGKSRDWLVRTLNILVDKSIPAKVRGQEWVIYFSRKKDLPFSFSHPTGAVLARTYPRPAGDGIFNAYVSWLPARCRAHGDPANQRFRGQGIYRGGRCFWGELLLDDDVDRCSQGHWGSPLSLGNRSSHCQLKGHQLLRYFRDSLWQGQPSPGLKLSSQAKHGCHHRIRDGPYCPLRRRFPAVQVRQEDAVLPAQCSNPSLEVGSFVS